MANTGDLIFKDHVQELGWGTHLCSIYRDKAGQLSVVAPYLAFGLQHNERCAYVTGEISKEEICRALSMMSLDAESHVCQGRLIFLTQEETYLRGGFFSPLGMLDILAQAHYQALKDGYGGLRVSGEGNWAAHNFPGSERILDYEREVNFLFQRNRLIALCQYNETIVPENILLGVMQTHPKAVIHGMLYDNPFFIPPHISDKQAGTQYRAGAYYQIRDSLIKKQSDNN
jgi:hypothetical protein